MVGSTGTCSLVVPEACVCAEGQGRPRPDLCRLRYLRVDNLGPRGWDLCRTENWRRTLHRPTLSSPPPPFLPKAFIKNHHGLVLQQLLLVRGCGIICSTCGFMNRLIYKPTSHSFKKFLLLNKWCVEQTCSCPRQNAAQTQAAHGTVINATLHPMISQPGPRSSSVSESASYSDFSKENIHGIGKKKAKWKYLKQIRTIFLQIHLPESVAPLCSVDSIKQ